MNLKEQRIYNTCNPGWYLPNWDGEYMAIEDDYKEEATFMWFKMHLDLLDDVFPASWSGSREEILDALYADASGFFRLISLAMVGEPECHTHESEALSEWDAEDAWENLLYAPQDEAKISDFWREILYRYAENDLRELFQEGYDNDKGYE